MLHASQTLAAKVHQLERKVSVHERNIAQLAYSMAAPPAPPKRPIGIVTPNEKPSASKASARATRKKI